MMCLSGEPSKHCEDVLVLEAWVSPPREHHNV